MYLAIVISEGVYVVLVLGSSAVAVAVSAWLWRTSDEPPARLFVALVLLHAVIGVLVVGELLAPSRTLAVRLFEGHSAVAGAVTPVWFLFTLAYVGYRGRITRRMLGFLGAWYGVLVALELTNAVHGLVWSDYVVETDPFPYVVGEATALSTVLTSPQGLFYYAGLAVLGWHLLAGSTARRTQTAVLLVGYLPPLVVIPAWFAGAVPGPLAGALVVASTWTLALAAWAAFRHQLFDLVPMARERVFADIEDAVLVVDRQGRLLDYNRTAVEKWPALADCEGDPVETTLPELLAEHGGTPVERGGATAEAGGSRSTPADGTVADAGDDEGARDGTGPAPGDASETAFTEAFTYYHGSGPREYSVSVTPLGTGGNVDGYALVVRDVTERRRHVRALERQTDQLERLVGTLSHDIRNPLNVADARVELAREDPDGDHLEKASDAVGRIEEIVDDTLTLAREGQAIDDRERVALAAVTQRAWATTDTGDATLVVDPDADVDVFADPSRLRSVFENLFRNAVEHGNSDRETVETEPEGGTDLVGSDSAASAANPAAPDATDTADETETALVRGGSEQSGDGDGKERKPHGGRDSGDDQSVTVTVSYHPDGFSVEDDGPGVPPDERDRVFEYEFTTAEGGTGLGLAIVDAIARAHGWSVEMTESDDGGARVVFSGVDVVDGDSAAS